MHSHAGYILIFLAFVGMAFAIAVWNVIRAHRELKNDE